MVMYDDLSSQIASLRIEFMNRPPRTEIIKEIEKIVEVPVEVIR
jgi:hypothetical protein